MELNQLEERLRKISIGCEKCQAKMCGICPNGRLKKNIKCKINELKPCSQVKVSILKKNLKKLK